MANIENETMIILNDYDRERGYFQVYTTRKDHFDALMRRLKKHDCTPEAKTTTDSQTKKITSWSVKIPTNLLSRAFFPIKRSLTATQKQGITNLHQPRTMVG